MNKPFFIKLKKLSKYEGEYKDEIVYVNMNNVIQMIPDLENGGTRLEPTRDLHYYTFEETPAEILAKIEEAGK